MNNDTKKFFEKLAGVSEQEEFEPRLAKVAAVTPTQEEDEEMEDEEQEGDFEEGEGQLAIDVYQMGNDIIIEAPVAGVGMDDLDLEISPESVAIRGKRDQREKIADNDYLYQECYWGKFSRSIILPQEINPDHATATFKNGVLRITLPKVNKQKMKKVKVRFE
ncbi:MAG: Protein containing Heat shock protein Hsp20 protein [Candidatus Wolfebacteria bacterium GW2011_GWE2_44_13]|uniref:Protein containing Heat shock protein Hsp20 protein n=1 Tax=Candidatus Wolfebacteria bacterium GW2011_GWE2_44_13 TaxID=1619017 RepID=A0A0G1HAE3_9BACT|nr:MAG: Protein containing Heat shock protein Hsp20 protein [Candidatus Wolfebacteria bacterium GW2011_GWE2_44_13]